MKRQLRLISGRKIDSPIGNSARPTSSMVREAVINIIRNKISNSNLLDLFSGSGIIGCEAIENGANSVLAIELNKSNWKICKSNLIKIANTSTKKVFIDVKNIEANKFLKNGHMNYFKSLEKINSLEKFKFDLIYIDPPYKTNPFSSILNNLIYGDWVSKQCLVICEFSIRQEINIPSKWIVKNKKTYGSTCLLFLTPNQEENSHVDIDSMH